MEKKLTSRFKWTFLAATLLLSSCDDSYVGLRDDEDADSTTQTPVVMQVSNNDKDLLLYTYAFKKDKNVSYSSKAVSGSNDCLIDGSIDSPSSTAGRKTLQSDQDIYLSWESETDVLFTQGKTPYDFFAYHYGSARELGSTVRNKDNINIRLKIDGSQDLMTSKAHISEDQLNRPYFDNNTKNLLKAYAFSNYTARRSINPVFTFDHHLTRLRFVIYPASNTAHTVYVDEISAKSKDECRFTVVAKDRSKVGVDFSEDPTLGELFLKESDGEELRKEYYHTPENCDFSLPIYERESVQVGGSLFLAPSEKFEIKLSIKEFKESIHESTSHFTISPSTLGGFKAGMQYEIRLAIYGMMKVVPVVEAEPWGYGGELTIDEEDILFKKVHINKQFRSNKIK